MGMGHAGCSADIIDENAIRQTCPAEYQILQDLLIEHQMEWEELAQIVQFEYESENDEQEAEGRGQARRH